MENAGTILIESIASAVAQKFMKMTLVLKRVLDLSETATYMGLSEDAVKDLERDGKLVRVKLVRKTQYDIRDIDECIEQSKKKK